MSEVKRYWPEEIVGTGGPVVYAQDYERELHTAIAAGIRMQDKCAALKAENENLRLSWGLLRSENNALRQQRDKLAGLLDRVTTEVGRTITSELREEIDVALAEINP